MNQISWQRRKMSPWLFLLLPRQAVQSCQAKICRLSGHWKDLKVNSWPIHRSSRWWNENDNSAVISFRFSALQSTASSRSARWSSLSVRHSLLRLSSLPCWRFFPSFYLLCPACVIDCRGTCVPIVPVKYCLSLLHKRRMVLSRWKHMRKTTLG